jgi:hypothetical protein
MTTIDFAMRPPSHGKNSVIPAALAGGVLREGNHCSIYGTMFHILNSAQLKPFCQENDWGVRGKRAWLGNKNYINDYNIK